MLYQVLKYMFYPKNYLLRINGQNLNHFVEEKEKEQGIEVYMKLNATENEIELSSEESQNALVNVKSPFTISPRKLSKFYLIRKRIKLAFYKALIKLPNLIFGTDPE